jgi:hypothetical protein
MMIGIIVYLIWSNAFLFFLGLSLFFYGVIHFLLYYDYKNKKNRNDILQAHLYKVSSKRIKE